MTTLMPAWTLPASADELAAYLEREGVIHLHGGANGWRLAYIETAKCDTSECAKLRLATQRPANGGVDEAKADRL